MSCFFIKLSLGLGYLRILKLRHINTRWERIVCYVVIVCSCVMNLQLFFMVLFSCAADGFMPLDAPYGIATGKCDLVDNRGLLVSEYLQSATNVVADWTMVLLPIPTVLAEIIDKRTRLSIISILLIGAR
jgi:hypothetical protein